MKQKMNYLLLLLTLLFIVGCTVEEDTSNSNDETKTEEVSTASEEAKKEESTADNTIKEETKESTTASNGSSVKETTNKSTNDRFPGYKLIVVDGGNLSGNRQAKVVVDIGFGDREYWAFTNEYGQLVRVIADKIVLQDDRKEPVLSSGRYYADEAKVPGVERKDLDEGHVIADSLGGVSNAYNITPQDSTLNRHGDQAYMEDAIRKAGGATNFEAIITYPDTKTQIPSSYQYTYTIKGQKVVDKFNNVNPDKVNASLGVTDKKTTNSTTNKNTTTNKSTTTNKNTTTNKSTTTNNNAATTNKNGNLASVDTDGNGKVTIKEAKAAGYKMPITRDHWLYQYMDDRDGDGMVGE